MIGRCAGMVRIGKKHYAPCVKLGVIAVAGKPYCAACARREEARIDLERRQRAWRAGEAENPAAEPAEQLGFF